MLLGLGAGYASAQSGIAHLNSQEVIDAMPSYQDAVARLQKFEDDGRKELQAMQTDFDNGIREYQEKVQAGILTPVMQQDMEQRLAKKEQDLLARQQSLQTEMQAYSQELNQPILLKLEKAIGIVADRKGYDYVFDISTLLIAKGPDITREVIAEILLHE